LASRWYSRLEHTFGAKIVVGSSALDVGSDGLLTPQPSAEDAEFVCRSLPLVFRCETVSEAEEATANSADRKKKG
jgi:hypothetical protein